MNIAVTYFVSSWGSCFKKVVDVGKTGDVGEHFDIKRVADGRGEKTLLGFQNKRPFRTGITSATYRCWSAACGSGTAVFEDAVGFNSCCFSFVLKTLVFELIFELLASFSIEKW